MAARPVGETATEISAPRLRLSISRSRQDERTGDSHGYAGHEEAQRPVTRRDVWHTQAPLPGRHAARHNNPEDKSRILAAYDGEDAALLVLQRQIM